MLDTLAGVQVGVAVERQGEAQPAPVLADGIELWHSAVVRSPSGLFVHVEARGVCGKARAPRSWPMTVSWAGVGESGGAGANSVGEGGRTVVIQWFAADEADGTPCASRPRRSAEFPITPTAHA